jgi:hypothetical protein
MSEANSLATADQLRALGAKVKRRYKRLDPCPVSGVELRIQSLTEGEQTRYQGACMATRGAGLLKSRLEDASRRLFVQCLVDAQGNRLLGDNETGVFVNWDSADTTFLYNECAEHCSISRDDIEDLVKNSEATPVAS